MSPRRRPRERRSSDTTEPRTGPFGSRSVRVWTVLGGVAAVVAIILAVATPVFSPATPPETDLRLVDLAVQRPAEVDADVTEAGDPVKHDKQETVVADVTVRNNGRLPVE